MSFDYEKDISNGSKAWMVLLGNFTPTVRPEMREVKGVTIDESGEHCKTYYDSGELRELADACIEVANWLEARAESAGK